MTIGAKRTAPGAFAAWIAAGLVLILVGCTARASRQGSTPAGALAPGPTADAAAHSTPTLPPVGVRAGSTAPDFTLHDLEGRRLTLSTLRGKVVLINFWAVWCGFCRIEMPEIQAAYERYQDRDFIVLGVNFQEEAAPVRAFSREMGLTFPILLDTEGDVTLSYRVRGLPTSLFIDPRGVISTVHVGPLTVELLEAHLTQAGVQ